MSPPARVRFVVYILLALVVLFAVGYAPYASRERQAQARARQEAARLPVVNVVPVRRSPGVSHLVLPGSIAPVVEAFIYARASGYVRRRMADIGDRVQNGQVLADIESPELDQQVAQARAALAQAEQQLGQAHAALEDAQARLALAQVTWQRYRTLFTQDAISREDLDTQHQAFLSAQASVRSSEANIGAAEQNVRANQANVGRLVSMQQFETVRAPFAGVVTARNVDVGALIGTSGNSQSPGGTPPGDNVLAQSAIGGSGTGGTTGGELFRVARIETLRILVTVPQENATDIRLGAPARVTVQELPNQVIAGRVTRTARALDPVQRTLQTEVQVQNPGAILMPGMYAQVEFETPRRAAPLLVPGEAVVARASGSELAILQMPTEADRQRLRRQANGQEEPRQSDREAREARRVHFAPVVLGRDYGTNVEIVGGLQGWEYVIVNPGDAVQEGALVIPHASRATAAGGRGGQPQQQAPAGITSPSQAAPTQGRTKTGRGSNR